MSEKRIPEFWTTRLVRETPPPEFDRPELTSTLRGPDAVAGLFWALWGDRPNERFVAFLLDTQHKVRGVHTVTEGIVDASLVHPREVLRPAILANSTAVILAHNHPSGDPTPSPEDKAVTRQVMDAAKAVGAQLLDHVVVGERGRYVSIVSAGLL
ncbi:MAG: JAB domain-containing protein [Gemmatimonadota bacterium]